MKFLFLIIASLLLIPAPVAAQETDQYHPFLSDRFQLALGVFSRNQGFRFGADGLVPEEEIDFDEAIGVDEDDAEVTEPPVEDAEDTSEFGLVETVEDTGEIPVVEHDDTGEVPVVADGMELTGKKILVVDDEPDILTFISTVLEDHGAEVTTAHNADKAIELARSVKPDLVTLEITMPGKDGGHVFEVIRNDPELQQMRVCIISGKPELRRLIYDRAVPPPEGFMEKPITEDGLLLNVRKILEVGAAERSPDSA